MTAVRMDGAALAARIREEVAREVSALGDVGLATVLVGDDPASEIYIRHKHTAAEAAGIRALDHRLPAETRADELAALIEQLNADADVHGILVQSPLPAHLDENAIVELLDPAKDVDGLHPTNAGLLLGDRPAFVPATPLGVLALLDEYDVPLEGRRAVVIGRSILVGKPVAMLLLARNATVTLCHSRTADLAAHTREADVLVAAVGRAGIVRADMVKDGAAVVDVGIVRTAEGLLGDVDPAASERAAFMSPVPGGVGPMTIAMLLRNTVLAARRARLAFP